MQKMKRILSVFLTLIMLIGLLPQAAFAANDRAYVRFADGTVKNYGSFRTAWDAAAASNNATVGLLDNWESGRYVVPNGKTMTLELNGYWLSRNLGDSDSKGDGEVLNVGYGSTLNVYGGKKEDPAYRSDAEHNMWVYAAREYDKPSRK